eukprot:393889_1
MNFLIYVPIISKDTTIKIGYIELLLSSLTLIIGVIIGLWMSYKSNIRCVKHLKKIISYFAVIGMVLIFIGSLYHNFTSESTAFGQPLKVIFAPLILTSIAYFVAFFVAKICKLKNNSCIAVAIECSNQNCGNAIAIIALTFSDGESFNNAISIPIAYFIFSNALTLIMGVIFRKMGYLVVDEADKAVSFRRLWTHYRGNSI